MKALAKLTLLILLGVVVRDVMAVAPEVVDRGWKAQVELAGEGDRMLAVARIKELTELQSTVFTGLDFDPQTQSFLDKMWVNLEDFNLRDYYTQLPEKDAEWRQLRVYGSRRGDHYQVGPNANDLGMRTDGRPSALGDMSVLVRAKKIDGAKGDHYLLQNDMQLGVGEIRWSALQTAAAETFRLVVGGAPEFKLKDQQRVAQVFRDKVIRMNPHLGIEDVDILAPLWASFPAMWELLSQIGSIDDVVYHDLNQPYRQLKVSFAIDPQKIKKSYPYLGNHLINMERLFQGSFRLTDDRGELLTVEIDSKSLRGQFQAFVADGRIVPVKGGQVRLNVEPIADNKPWNFIAHMNSTMTILGVVTHIDNAKARIQFLSQEDGFKMVGQFSDVPDIRVQGSALGIMPTAMIDVVMPKSLAEIIQDFMGVVCNGNDGKGMLLGLQFQQSSQGESGNLILKSAFEGLDNFFVRIGMGIVNDKVLPDPRVSGEVRQLVFDTQKAFASDLKAFELIANSKQLAANATN